MQSAMEYGRAVMQQIENPMILDEYCRPVTSCDECKDEIYEGDTYYMMPDGSTVCHSCLKDWSYHYMHTASQEDFADGC